MKWGLGKVAPSLLSESELPKRELAFGIPEAGIHRISVNVLGPFYHGDP